MSAAAWLIVVFVGAVTIVSTEWVRRHALRRNWLDIPNARSSHVGSIPRGGGLAIVVATTLGFAALTLFDAIRAELFVALTGGGLAVAYVGFLDDRRPVSPVVRLVVHLAAAAWALAWLGGVPPFLFGTTTLNLGITGYVLGVIAIGWTINLFNFMDGIDGLAAGEAAFVAGAGAWLGAAAGSGVTASAALFAASCLGFLWWNWPPARIFLGDVGSGYLGYTLGVLAVAEMGESQVAMFAWLVLGAIFLTDATVTLARRIFRGERVHEAHRTHAYQWLARAWGGHAPVTLAVLLLDFVILLPIAAICMAYPGHAWSVVLWTLAVFVLMVLMAGAGRSEADKNSGAIAKPMEK